MTTNNNDTRWIQRLSNYDKALERLSKAADILSTNKMLGDDVDDLLKEGLVQRFEIKNLKVIQTEGELLSIQTRRLYKKKEREREREREREKERKEENKEIR